MSIQPIAKYMDKTEQTSLKIIIKHNIFYNHENNIYQSKKRTYCTCTTMISNVVDPDKSDVDTFGFYFYKLIHINFYYM